MRKSGQITPRGPGKFLVRVFLDRDSNGKRRYINQVVKGNKKDAQAVLNKILHEKDNETIAEPNRITVEDYLNHWLETAARPRVTARTFQDYKGLLFRYVNPTLGKKPLLKLTPINLQSLYTKMYLPKDNSGLGLTARTVIVTHRVLNSAFKQAVKWRILSQNICQYVDLPKRQKTEMNAMNEEEVVRFLEAARSDRYYALFSVMIGTGIRPGEVLGLMWKDFNPLSSTLIIQRSVEVANGKRSFKTPKTPGSRRSIKLPESLVKELLEYKAGLKFQSELMFPSDEDTILNDRNLVNRHFKPILEMAGLGETVIQDLPNGETKEKFIAKFRLYDLRHTHATLLLKAGVHPKIVSERLGHSNISLTLDTYSHVLPGMQDEAAIKLDAMMYPQEKPPASQAQKPRIPN